MSKFILLFTLLFSQLVLASGYNDPKTVSELRETSVRILNLEETSGGTGVIFRSFNNATHILTNKHVCRLIEPGGIVDHNGTKYLITHYKKFEQHDLCLVRIQVNLNINIEIAESLMKVSSKSVVSGHPQLLPNIVTTGHLSDRQDIEIVSGLRKCTPEDLVNDPMTCSFLGGYPVIQTFDSQILSNLIMPGNSGSAVYNKDGKLIGIIFAGNGRGFSFGYMVPQIYLYYFTQNAHNFPWVKVGTPVDDKGMIDRVFNYEKCKEVQFKDDSYKTIKELCNSVNDTLIWRK